ncbi:MAG: Molybdopterin-guanine dinucleotide biosynthesis protein A-like protein [Pseudonocardia sp.]|nr:Molybdopterin-guanine dinucleotide biosynthesis protein A-like protein [Pseudonocardia sp.]
MYVSPSSDANALSEWVTAVARELGLEEALDSATTVDMVLDLTSDVAHGVSRPGAPVTAFLVGVAAGRAEDPAVAARDYAQKVSRLADGWAGA